MFRLPQICAGEGSSKILTKSAYPAPNQSKTAQLVIIPGKSVSVVSPITISISISVLKVYLNPCVRNIPLLVTANSVSRKI